MPSPRHTAQQPCVLRVDSVRSSQSPRTFFCPTIVLGLWIFLRKIKFIIHTWSKVVMHWKRKIPGLGRESSGRGRNKESPPKMFLFSANHWVQTTVTPTSDSEELIFKKKSPHFETNSLCYSKIDPKSSLSSSDPPPSFKLLKYKLLRAWADECCAITLGSLSEDLLRPLCCFQVSVFTRSFFKDGMTFLDLVDP